MKNRFGEKSVYTDTRHLDNCIVKSFASDLRAVLSELPERKNLYRHLAIYFYTKGQKGGSQAIKNMLTYLQNSDSKNAVDDATRIIDSYVKTVKKLPEVEAGYMTLGDWMDEIEEEIREEDIKVFIETLQKYCDSKQEVEAELQEKYPAYADRAAELVERYWQAE